MSLTEFPGVPFETASGNVYLYDDNTGVVFLRPTSYSNKHSSSVAVASETLEPSYKVGQTSLRNRTALWYRMKEQYGAFVERSIGPVSEPSVSEVRDFVLAEGFRQLILCVTWDCNLRCKYCYYSEEYAHSRNRSSQYMDFSVAKQAVDYYLSHLRTVQMRYPRRKGAITFYGGEPLLHFGLVQRVIEYIESLGVGDILFSITTNGTLLTQAVQDFLVQHGVSVCISLDGPPEEHDRLRVYPDGSGSFDAVYKYCVEFRRRYPCYPNSMLLSCHDWGTDLVATRDFFAQHVDELPPVGFVYPVVDTHTSYYNRYTTSDKELFDRRIGILAQDYARIKTNSQGASASSYLEALFGARVVQVLVRPGAGNRRPPGMPYTGACFPGYKMCVQPNGQIDICERVDGSFPIGHVDIGLDFHAIAELVRMYTRFVAPRCQACPVTKLCVMCFQTFNAGGTFVLDPPDLCNRYPAYVIERLTFTYSILEQNPRAFESFQRLGLRKCGSI